MLATSFLPCHVYILELRVVLFAVPTLVHTLAHLVDGALDSVLRVLRHSCKAALQHTIDGGTEAFV